VVLLRINRLNFSRGRRLLCQHRSQRHPHA
jgi:hypothetical protein